MSGERKSQFELCASAWSVARQNPPAMRFGDPADNCEAEPDAFERF